MNGTTVEHIKDAAPILGNYFDILCIRTFPGLANKDADYSEKIINQFIKYAGIPGLLDGFASGYLSLHVFTKGFG
jgi:N-succinyl-L-ornithine transcarbamylase